MRREEGENSGSPQDGEQEAQDGPRRERSFLPAPVRLFVESASSLPLFCVPSFHAVLPYLFGPPRMQSCCADCKRAGAAAERNGRAEAKCVGHCLPYDGCHSLSR